MAARRFVRRSTRLVLLSLFLGSAVAGEAVATPLPVRVQIYPFTGEVRFQNRNNVPLPLVSYSIASASGALDGANGVWTSVTDVYDENGNGFIAPTTLWQETFATPNLLAEQSSSGFAGNLPVFRSVSLGKIWNPDLTPVPDLVPDILQSVSEHALVDVRRAIDGDYDESGTVDNDDFDFWKFAYGSVAGPAFFFPADGNLDGVVNALDYVLWRNNLGLSLSDLDATDGGGGAATHVPEPSCAVCCFAIAMCMVAARMRRCGGRLAN